MSKLINVRFVLAALLITLCCLLLVLVPKSNGWLCFTFLPLLTTSRAEFTKPVSNREAAAIIGGLLIVVLMGICCKHFVPASLTAERVVHHPAFVLPVYGLTMWGLYGVYRKQKTEATA
jgi:hypothetical protein